MAALSLVSSTDTAASESGHPAPRAKPLVHIRAVRDRVHAQQISNIRDEMGWSLERLASVLGIDKKDAYAMCLKVEGTNTVIGKATAEQLATVMARAPRRAALPPERDR